VIAKVALAVLAAAVSAGAPALAQSAAPTHDGWQFEITPYIWTLGLDGEVKVGRLAAQGVEASFSDLTQVLDLALMGAFEARKGRGGVFVDSMYFDLSESEPTPDDLFGDANVGLKEQLYSIGGFYRVTQGKVSLDLLGGVRYGDLRADLELTSGMAAGRKADAGIDWWDGVAGARVLWPFAQKWSLVGYMEIGGGGTRLSWQALAGVNWNFSKRLAGKFGYRYLSIDYDQDDVVYDMAMAGGYAGLGIRW